MAEAVRAAGEAGATHLWWNVLNLRPGTRAHFLEALARDWPGQLDRYHRLYAGRAYLAKDVTAPIDAALTQLRGDWQVERRPRPQAMRSSGSRQLELPLIQPGA